MPSNDIFFIIWKQVFEKIITKYVVWTSKAGKLYSYKIRSILDELYVAGYVNYMPAYKLYWSDDSSHKVSLPWMKKMKWYVHTYQEKIDFNPCY